MIIRCRLILKVLKTGCRISTEWWVFTKMVLCSDKLHIMSLCEAESGRLQWPFIIQMYQTVRVPSYAG